jgi:hypothetical protein
MYFNLNIKTKLILTQNSTTTTIPNMLIQIFKHKNYVNNRFSELIPHEIALWCCKKKSVRKHRPALMSHTNAVV